MMRLKKTFGLLFLSIILIVALLLFFYFNKKDASRIIKNITANDLDITYGCDSAPINIIMFSDYNCVYCKKFLLDVFPLVKSEYINKGKIKFILKLISFSSNPQLRKVYKTAVCLNKYGDFEELNKLLLMETDAIYSDQMNELVEDYINRNSFFAECMLSGKADDYLNENRSEFIKNKFSGTPTFIINNKVYKGFMEYGRMIKIINKELRKH